MHNIGTRKQVFIDDRFIVEPRNVGLVVNPPVKAGQVNVEVELQDQDGVPLPGFSQADAVSIDRNGTAQEVWWQGGPDVSALAGRPVRLRFVMRSAKLFAFQFAG